MCNKDCDYHFIEKLPGCWVIDHIGAKDILEKQVLEYRSIFGNPCMRKRMRIWLGVFRTFCISLILGQILDIYSIIPSSISIFVSLISSALFAVWLLWICWPLVKMFPKYKKVDMSKDVEILCLRISHEAPPVTTSFICAKFELFPADEEYCEREEDLPGLSVYAVPKKILRKRSGSI